MTESTPNSLGDPPAPKQAAQGRTVRRWLIGGLIGAGVLLGLVVAVPIWYFQTPGFQARLRDRFAGNLERLTGGRVELGALAWNLRKLQFEARNLTIHGLEPADEVPYAHVDRLAVRLKILSLFRREIGLRYIELDRPIVHLIVYPDGSTNQPAPRRPATNSGSPIEQLFAIDVSRAEIHDGLVLLNQRSWRLDFSAERVSLLLSYAGAQSKYEGDLRLGKVEIASAGALSLPLEHGSTGPDWFQRPNSGGNAGPKTSSSASQSGVAEPIAPNRDSLQGRGLDRNASPSYPPALAAEGLGRMAGSGEVRFSLWRDHLQVDSLQISSGHSQLQASGGIQDFNHPIVQAAYFAALDGAELGSLLRLPEVRTGTVTLNGQVQGNAQAFASSGKIAVRDLDYMDRDFRVARVSGGAQFTVTNDRLALPHIFLSVFGGTATGDMEVLHWRGSEDSNVLGVPVGTAHLLVHNWLVSRVASATATSTMPLERLHAAGTANGAVAASWRRSPENLVAELSLEVAAPSNLTPGELPVNAQLKATYDHAAGAFKIDHLSLATPATQLNATGVLDLVTAKGANSKSIVILSPPRRAKNLLSHARAQKQQVPSLRSGQALRSAQDDNCNAQRGTYASNEGHGALAFDARAANSLNAGCGGASTMHRRPARAGLEITVTTRDLNECARVIAALGGPSGLPVDLHGKASFHGALTGRITSPRIAGHLEAADFDSLFVAGAGPRRIHWDTFSAGVEYSPVLLAAHHALLRRGAAQIDVDGTARMEDYRLTESSPFTVQADLHSVQVADVMSATGYTAQLEGTLNAGLRVSGTAANPQGHANLVITEATVYDQPVQRMSADVNFGAVTPTSPTVQAGKTSDSYQAKTVVLPQVIDKRQGAVTSSAANVRPTTNPRQAGAGDQRPTTTFDFTAIQITQNGATVTGTAGYTPETTAYHFDLRGNGLNLGQLRWLRTSRTSLSGKLSFSANGSGTEEAPAVNADVQLSGLMMNGERMGAVQANAVTTGDTLHFTAHSASPPSNWNIGGTARMRGDFPAKLDMTCDQASLEPFLHMLLNGRVIGHSVVTGKFTAEGPLRSPRQFVLGADLSGLLVDVERVQLHNDGPIRFTLARQTLHIQQMQVSGTNTSVTASGAIQLTGNQELDMEAKGQVDLKLLESLDPTAVSRGTLALDLRANGTLTRPLIRGRLDVTNAAISQIDLPNGLSDLNGHLVFNEDRLQIRDLSGKSGGGTLDIGGDVTYGRGISYNLNAKGHDIRLRYPPGVSSLAEAELRLTGSPQSALLAGDITITRFEVNPQFDFASYLARSRQITVTTSDSLASRLRLDVHLASTPELQVQTSLAKVSGDLDLHLRGTEARPVLLGRVNITEGDISFNGTKYHMERGGITFSNPVTIQPVLDIEATTSVRDYDINLGLHGPLDKLSTTYRSDPPLATADIVSLLAFGRVREDLAMQSASASNLTPEAQTVLYQALNAAVSSRMQKLFGVSRIKIDPQAAGADYNSAGPRLTIEQQVANNITLTYITDVTRANYQSIQAEYAINRNLSVVAIRDWNGIVSFDIRIRQRKR